MACSQLKDFRCVCAAATKCTKRVCASGKIRHATKAKANQRVRIRLVVPEGRTVQAPATGSPSWCRVTMERKEHKVVLEAKAKYPKPSNAGDWQLKTILLVLGQVFRWLPPVADDGAGSAGGAEASA